MNITGEVLIDLQECSVDVPATTYEGRIRRWLETDLTARWRESFRRQERLKKERDERKAEYEKEKAERARQQAEAAANAAHWGGGGKQRKGKGRGGPFGKGKQGISSPD